MEKNSHNTGDFLLLPDQERCVLLQTDDTPFRPKEVSIYAYISQLLMTMRNSLITHIFTSMCVNNVKNTIEPILLIWDLQ